MLRQIDAGEGVPRYAGVTSRVLAGALVLLSLVEISRFAPALLWPRPDPYGLTDGARWLCGLLPIFWLLATVAGLLVPKVAKAAALSVAASALLTAPILSEPLFDRDLYPLFVRHHCAGLGLALALALALRVRRRPTGARDTHAPGAPIADPPRAAMAAASEEQPPSVWTALDGCGYFLPVRRHDVRERRIDPPRLLSSVAIVGITQYFWQYRHGNLVFFALDAVRYLYLPPQDDAPLGEPPAQTTLERLPARAWEVRHDERPDWERYASCFAIQAVPATFLALPETAAATLDRFGPEVDLAPRLYDDLRRIAMSPDPDTVALALGLLDVLATCRGHGSDELDAPAVRFGEAAAEELAAHLGVVPQTVRRELRDHAPGAGDGALRRVSALVQKRRVFDSTVGGYRDEIALVTLTVAATGWRYERAVLWSHTREGIEMS